MSRRLGLRRTLLVLAVVMSMVVPTAVSAAPKAVRHCFNGDVDLNEQLGVSETIVWYTCPDIKRGLTFRVAQAFGMAATFEVIPEGFVPAGPTPLADFLAKVVGRKVVIDPGTPDERAYTFTNIEDLYTDADPNGSIVNGVKLGLLDPLDKGRHVIQMYWTMNAMHCDGLVDGGCLMPGDNADFPLEIRVR